MDLKELIGKLFEETQNIFEAVTTKEVDWAYPEVTILTTTGKSQEAGSGGMTDDSAQIEVIDPENQEQQGGQGSQDGQSQEDQGQQDGNSGQSGDGGESGGSESNQVQVGSIIQDMATGEYGKVVSVDQSTGDVEWEPVSNDELEKQGYLTKRAGVWKPTNKMKKFNMRGVNGLIG